MHESLVQWTLLNNSSTLSEVLNYQISKHIGRELSTEFGRIDFVVSSSHDNYLIVELETLLNDKSKRGYCFEQILRYQNVKFTGDTQCCILYASETSASAKKEVDTFCLKHNIMAKTYSLNAVKSLYASTVRRLSLNVGLNLPAPKNYTIFYLRWLNKILKPFRDAQKGSLHFDQIFLPFQNKAGSRTNFNCYERLAMDFEMIDVQKTLYHLTTNGVEFTENMNPFVDILSNVSSVDLTNEQKRIVLKVLTNGNWEGKIHKVNIYWFLRFIEVTNGSWLPKIHDFDEDRLDLARSLFNVSYQGRTMHEFLTWCANYCEELGIIERVKSTTTYDTVLLTPLGVEVQNLFSLDLTLKKSRMNLSFKYL
jgi:hypothetical protein